MHAPWKLTNLRKSVWKELTVKIMKDRIAGKGFNSSRHQNLVHKFIPMPQAIVTPDANAAVDKEWEKLEKLPAWYMTN